MPTVDNLDIQISTSLKNTDKMLDNLIAKLGVVNKSLSGIGGATTKTSSGMSKLSVSATKSTKSFKGLAASFGKFYANYFWVVRGIKSLYKSIEGTADYIEAFNYFEVSFNKIAKEWKQDFAKYGKDIGANTAKEYADSFNKRAKESLSKLSGVQVSVGADGKGLLTETGMKNLGLNIQQITQYASQLASITNSVGQTGEVSLATANSFTKLAGDISSLFNQDYSSVAKNLQSGLIGQSRALYKYGIDITNATLQTYAYELGLEKAVSEMTQAEKMQLRMIAILDQSKVSWGDLANTINSPSNMIRQFKNNLKEAGMVLGQLFIPLLSKVLPVINGVTIAIKRLLVNIAGFLGIELDFSEFGQGASDLGDSYGDISDGLDDVAESAKKAKAGLRGFDELKTINMPESSGGASGLGSTIDLTNEIIAATEEYEKVWKEAYDKMEQKAEKYAKSIEKVFNKISKTFKKVSLPDLDFTNLNESLGNLWNTISNFGGNDIGENLNYLMVNFFNPLAEWTIEKAVPSVLDFVSSTLKFLGSLTPSLDNLWKVFFKPIAEWTGGVIITVLDGVSIGLTKVSDWIDENQDLVVLMTEYVAAFFAIWGGYTVLTKVKSAMETLYIKMLYFKDGINGLLTPTNLWIAALATLAVGLIEVTKNWNKMTSLQKVVTILSSVAAAASAAAIAIGIFHTSWSVGLAAATIAAGIALIVGTKASIKKATDSKEYMSIPQYEVGGFPDRASLFWANENGVPELVGTMGGKTAVASGAEITGIKDAIYSTGQQETNLMQTMVGLLKIIAEKEYGITDSDIGKSAQRYAREYFNRTGNEAYSF